MICFGQIIIFRKYISGEPIHKTVNKIASNMDDATILKKVGNKLPGEVWTVLY